MIYGDDEGGNNADDMAGGEDEPRDVIDDPIQKDPVTLAPSP
jgi:hypothetical protein